MDDHIIVNCPHCEEPILIMLNELNCKIFRHGIYKHNHKQIDPHLPKVACDELKKKDLIYGCGKPFQIVINSTENSLSYKAQICDYV